MSATLLELRTRALERLPQHLPKAFQIRHAIHRAPRVGGDEHATREFLKEQVDFDGVIDIAEGFLARLDPTGGAIDAPAIGIRAELDALPVQETSDVAWKSERDGAAHLCGHDVHQAALVAVWETLREIGAPFPFVALFQPREEQIPSGAVDVIADPALRAQGMKAFIGVHVQPVLLRGSVSCAPGAINAAADNFEITVHGTPSHGAYPHLSRDPIVAIAGVVQGLQHLVSRRIDPMLPAVVTIGQIEGGDSHNAIPSSATLRGTIRSYNEVERTLLHREIRRVAEGIAAAHDCTAQVDVHLGEPVLHNNAELAMIVADELHADGFRESEALRSCGADDFAYYGEVIPSLMIFAGVGDGDRRSPGLHHPAFAPPDQVVAEVARIMLLSYFAVAADLAAQ